MIGLYCLVGNHDTAMHLKYCVCCGAAQEVKKGKHKWVGNRMIRKRRFPLLKTPFFETPCLRHNHKHQSRNQWSISSQLNFGRNENKVILFCCKNLQF